MTFNLSISTEEGGWDICACSIKSFQRTTITYSQLTSTTEKFSQISLYFWPICSRCTFSLPLEKYLLSDVFRSYRKGASGTNGLIHFLVEVNTSKSPFCLWFTNYKNKYLWLLNGCSNVFPFLPNETKTKCKYK